MLMTAVPPFPASGGAETGDAGRQHGQDFFVENELQLLNGVEVGWIVDDDLQSDLQLSLRRQNGI